MKKINIAFEAHKIETDEKKLLQEWDINKEKKLF